MSENITDLNDPETAAKTMNDKTESQAVTEGKEQKRRPYRAGRPTQDELERRKAKVMQVATALFVQHGYAATSLIDIAKAAGVATRTVYQHFGDKEAIFLEVVSARESAAVFSPPSLAGEPTLHDALMRMARYVCDVSLRERSVDLMRLVIAESRRFPDFMRELCDATFKRFRAHVAEMFDELTESGVAPESDSAEAAYMFTDLILGSTPLMVYAGWLMSRPSEAELEAKVNLFITGWYGPEVAKVAKEQRVN